MNKNKNKKICPFCNGEGFKAISIPCSNMPAWFDDGEGRELGFQDCKHCKGTGFILPGSFIKNEK